MSIGKEFSKNKKEKCALSVSFVTTAVTKDEAEEVKNTVQPYVDDFMVMNANNRGGSASESEAQLFAGGDRFSHKYPCSQIFNNVYATAEGYMVICSQNFENLTVVADLHNEDVVSAWNNQKFTDFRKRYINHDLDDALCVNCLGIKDNAMVIRLSPEKAYCSIDDQREKDMNNRIDELAKRIKT